MNNVYIILSIFFVGVIAAGFVFFTMRRQNNISGKEMIDAFSSMGSLKSLLEEIDTNQRQLSDSLQRTQSDFNQRILDQNSRMQQLIDMADVGSKVQGSLQEHVQRTLESLEAIRAEAAAKEQRDEENRRSLQRLEGIIAGTKTKGMAGENILREALKVFPHDMVATEYRVGTKVVEFGFILSDKKILPIDSKWPSTELIESLLKETDDTEKEKIRKKIENELEKRASEVATYIDPKVTTPWAIAAVPNAVFNTARRIHFDSYKKYNVILISYGMALPFLLAFFSLHLSFSKSIDIENLRQYLIDIRRHMDKMDEILENKLRPAIVRLTNTSEEYKQIISAVKADLASIESSRPKESALDTHK